MSIPNALIHVDNIATAFSAADPANAATCAANAIVSKAQLTAALDPLKARIAALPEDSRWLATCESAFSDLGPRPWPVRALPLADQRRPAPRQVRAVIDGVRAHRIPAVFRESTVSSDPAEQVARETGAAFGGILHVDSLSEGDGPVPTYLALLKVTTETIAKGLLTGPAPAK